MVDSAAQSHESWRELSLAELEREYSPSSCVPNGDLDPFIQRYIDDSADARTDVQAAGNTLTEVRYGTNASQTIDVAVPAQGDGARPLLVFIHGGYWQQLSKRESFFAASNTVTAGAAFAAIDYTLAPAASLDAIVSECRAALTALRAAAIELRIDPERIVVAGSSAGAHLAAMVALTPDQGWRPAGCGLVSGIYDLEPIVGTYINDAVGLDLAAAARNSPLGHDLAGFPRTVVAVGSNETSEFKRQSTAMTNALRLAGTQVDQLEIAERNHFDVILDLCTHQTDLGAAMLDLLVG